MSRIEFDCNGVPTTTNDCVDCPRINDCELYLNMSTEEDDRMKDAEKEKCISIK